MRAVVAIVKTALDMYGDEFKWKEPPYEYEYERNPFDVIAGTLKLREQLERGDSVAAISSSWEMRAGAISSPSP